MISTISIISMIISAIVSLALPIWLYVYFKRKFGVTKRTVWVGVVIWIAFAQALEASFHLLVLPGSNLLSHPLLFAIYGALAAGVFEEVGRYVAFSYFLKEQREWKDGVGYGIGHGGAESVLLGAGASLELLVFALLFNAGRLASATGQLPPDISKALTATLTAPAYMFLLIGIERVFAIIFHIALSLVVLYAVRKDNVKYVLGAILLHAFLDFPAGLYQAGTIKIWAVEAIAGVMSMLLVWFIIRMKKNMSDSPMS